MTLKQELDKLLSAIVEKASQKDASLPEMTDALKAATQYYAVLRKDKNANNDENGEATFEGFQSSIHAVEEPSSGRTKAIPSRQ